MTGPAHDRAQLGAYAIGALDPVEARMVHEHLNGCHECQREVSELMMIRRALDQVPPEAFLDGPPEDGQLLLRRTLRRVAAEAPPAPPRRRMTGVYVAAAAAVAVALGGGIILGRESAPSSEAGPTFTVATRPSNAIIAEGENSETGATMSIALEPKKGWVWVDATATGLPAGKPCALYVISNQGDKVLAGTWMVSPEGAKNSRVTGMALVSPDDVKSVVIETIGDEKEVVTVPI